MINFIVINRKRILLIIKTVETKQTKGIYYLTLAMKANLPITIQRISSDENIELAYQQLCRGWANKGDNHDCWHLRFHWQKIKPQIQQLLRIGDYYLSPSKE
jgi:hypothetical protein